jgi:hypothetical protein
MHLCKDATHVTQFLCSTICRHMKIHTYTWFKQTCTDAWMHITSSSLQIVVFSIIIIILLFNLNFTIAEHKTKHLCMYKYMYSCDACLSIKRKMYVCMHVCMYTCMYMCIHVTPVTLFGSIHTCIHTYMHTHMQKYTQRHMNTCILHHVYMPLLSA